VGVVLLEHPVYFTSIRRGKLYFTVTGMTTYQRRGHHSALVLLSIKFEVTTSPIWNVWFEPQNFKLGRDLDHAH